jgi:hypothetical protein
MNIMGKSFRGMHLWIAYPALTDRIWLPTVTENMTDSVRPTYVSDIRSESDTDSGSGSDTVCLG